MIGLRLALQFLLRRPLALLVPGLAIAGCLIPILVIWSLKLGYVDGLIQALQSNARNLEIRLRGDRTLGEADIEAMAALPGVGYLVPTTRGLSARVFVGRIGERAQQDASLLPSTAGDPLLGAIQPPGEATTVLTRGLADALGVKAGETVEVRSVRFGSSGIFRVPLKVEGILEPETLSGRRMLVTPTLIEDVEDFIDGYALPARGITEGSPPSSRPRSFANARIYADRLENVAPLVRSLEALGNIPEADDGAIASALALQRGAAMLVVTFGSILSIGAAVTVWGALALALLPHLRTVALFRLMGGTRLDVVLFVNAINLTTVLVAFALTAGGYEIVNRIINESFGALSVGQAISALPPDRIAVAAAIVFAAAWAIGMLFSRIFLRMQPKEALGDGS